MVVKCPPTSYDAVMTLGHRVQELRQGRNWTREQLAVYSGLSASTIRRVEKDEIRPRPATLIVLANALDIPPQELAAEAGIQIYVPKDKWS